MKKWCFTVLSAPLLTVSAWAGGWSNLSPIPNGLLADAPAVAIDGTGRIHVAGRGKDNALWYTESTDGGQTWAGWQSKGGVLTKAPACVAPYSDATLDCYVVTTAGSVAQIYRNAQGWSDYMDHAGVLAGNVAVMAPADDQRLVVGIGNDAKTFSTKAWSLVSGWQPWQANLPANPKAAWALNVGCRGVPGNSTQTAKGAFTDYDYVCMTVGNGHKVTAVAGRLAMSGSIPPAFYTTDYTASTGHAPAVLARMSPRTGNGNVGITADVFMVSQQGTLLNGIYVVGKGWTVKPTPMGLTGTKLKSAVSCDRRPAANGVKAVCAGVGADDAVWITVQK